MVPTCKIRRSITYFYITKYLVGICKENCTLKQILSTYCFKTWKRLLHIIKTTLIMKFRPNCVATSYLLKKIQSRQSGRYVQIKCSSFCTEVKVKKGKNKSNRIQGPFGTRNFSTVHLSLVAKNQHSMTLISFASRLASNEVSYVSISSCYLCSFIFPWSARKHKLWTPRRLFVAGEGVPPALCFNEKCFGPFVPLCPFCGRHLQGYCVNRTLRYFFECRLQKSTGKTVFSPARPSSFAFDFCFV
jgi:hypothetical protein